MERSLVAALNAERQARRAVMTITDTSGGSVRLIREVDDFSDDPLAPEIGGRLRSGRSGLVGDLFFNVHLPPPRLVMIGAVHISQALAPVARISGFDVTIVDPRTAFATEERFPGIDLRPDWPETVLPKLGIDRFTALAALTHDPKIDDFAIAHALEKRCFYVGALGSRKTHGKRLERLSAAGVSKDDLDRIHAPIGVDIGAISPAEIAVAVTAEIIAALRQRQLSKEAGS